MIDYSTVKHSELREYLIGYISEKSRIIKPTVLLTYGIRTQVMSTLNKPNSVKTDTLFRVKDVVEEIIQRYYK